MKKENIRYLLILILTGFLFWSIKILNNNLINNEFRSYTTSVTGHEVSVQIHTEYSEKDSTTTTTTFYLCDCEDGEKENLGQNIKNKLGSPQKEEGIALVYKHKDPIDWRYKDIAGHSDWMKNIRLIEESRLRELGIKLTEK